LAFIHLRLKVFTFPALKAKASHETDQTDPVREIKFKYAPH